MKKNKIAALLLTALVVTTSVGCGKQETAQTNDIKVDDKITTETAAKKYGIEDKQITDGINLINTFDCAWIHKQITESEIGKDESDISNTTDLLDAYSIISINDKTDITYLDKGINDKADFKDTFGFDYKNINNAWDIFYNLYATDEIDMNYEDAELDIDMYLYLDEKRFVLKDSSKIAEKLMKDVDYDEITNSIVSFDIDTYKNKGTATNYVDNITASIYYKKDNKNYMRIIIYQIALMDKKDMDSLVATLNSGMSGCGCAPDSGCNTGTNDPCEPECDMPDKIE